MIRWESCLQDEKIFFFLWFYVEASELFHVASGLESILKQTAQYNCHHCLNLMKIG